MTALTSIVVIALIATPSGPRPGSLDTRGVLGHEAVPAADGVAFAPEALSEFDPSAEANTTGESDGPKVLRLVYFIEADAPVDREAPDLIEAQAFALQQFWYEQFGGTFALPAEGVEIVFGDHPAAWYDEMPNGDEPRWNRLLNVEEEVRAKLGLADGQEARMVVYPATRLDGRVGAIRYAGAWMDGDDITCIDGSSATIPYAADYPANCLMTVAHELGHVYGLGHQGDEVYCMQFGFYRYVSGTDNCDFSPLSREMVTSDARNEGWLDAVPGERR
ncbi:MAG: hypothetical protein AAF962_08705 [Actinomycetota bacterium]